MTGDPPARLDRTGYTLTVDERFESTRLDPNLWIPHYLPQWSSRAASAARYTVGGGELRLRIDADQAPWCPEWDGPVRVSSLQTGVQSGPVGSAVGQHRFKPDVVVREAQPRQLLYTPCHGLFEVQARALSDRDGMVALWMIGIEDRPEQSAEICVMEIFGRDVEPGEARVGVGVHPHHDPAIRDEFEQVRIEADVREPHWYAAEWTAQRVAFYVDERLVKAVEQSPDYPMQLMLNIYDFRSDGAREPDPERYPKEFMVHRFRGWQPVPAEGDSGSDR